MGAVRVHYHFGLVVAPGRRPVPLAVVHKAARVPGRALRVTTIATAVVVAKAADGGPVRIRARGVDRGAAGGRGAPHGVGGRDQAGGEDTVHATAAEEPVDCPVAGAGNGQDRGSRGARIDILARPGVVIGVVVVAVQGRRVIGEQMRLRGGQAGGGRGLAGGV